jgi:enoyl-CoA hydratase
MIQTMAESQINFEVMNGLGVMTINRPDSRNALSPIDAKRMIELCDVIDRDPSIGVLIVKGAEGTFCSGADLSMLQDVSSDPCSAVNFEMLGLVYRSFLSVGKLSVPTIAAVRGVAVGAGLNLVLACDLRIVAEDARLFSGFERIGIHPGGGHFHLLMHNMGKEAAVAMGIFGEEIDGIRAVELGLAWKALPDAKVEEEAMELGAKVGRDPALARMAIGSFRHLSNIPWNVAVEGERSAQMWSLRRSSSI